MPASEVHEAEIRERSLLGAPTSLFTLYSQNIDDVVYTSCIMAPEVKVQVNRRKWTSNEVDSLIK